MLAKDLMIGDWVSICGEPKQVKDIDVRRIGIVFSKLIHAVDETQVFPVPLTAEILEKNGFVKSSVFVEWKYEEEGIYVLWKPFPFLKIETENVQLNLSGCKYVHELQRALRCCGLFDKANDIVV